MLAVDEVAALLRLYRRLAREVGGYVARNLGGLVLACLPVAAFLALVTPAALALWDRRADQLAFYPSPAAWASARSADPALDLEPAADARRTALCWTATHCTLFRLLAFRVIEQPAPLLADAPYAVARAGPGAGNFLWPYLDDLEFAFAGAFMVASIGSLFRRRPGAR